MSIIVQAKDLLASIPGIELWDMSIIYDDDAGCDPPLTRLSVVLKRGKSRCNIRFMLEDSYEWITPSDGRNEDIFNTINTLINAGFRTRVAFQFTLRDSLLNFNTEYITASKDKARILCSWRGDELCIEIKARVRGKHYRRIRIPQDISLENAIIFADKLIESMNATTYENITPPNIFKPTSYSSHKEYVGVGGDPGNKITMKKTDRLRSISVIDAACLQPDGGFTFDTADPGNKHVWIIVYAIDIEGLQRVLAVNGDEWYELDGKKYLYIGMHIDDLTTDDQLFINDCINNWAVTSQS